MKTTFNNWIILIVSVLCLSAVQIAQCQQDTSSDKETDPLVLKKLEWFQDMKFGLLMHWGTYSQWGIVESWSICPEDEGWCERRGKYASNYFEYKSAYENLKTTFNPVKFEPEKWAAAAKDAGMKYVIFTTKHHDGFCMFDTKQTDYKITDKGCPFSSNPRSNVAKEIFNAFREKGFGVGTYFSKPDWHTPDYWWPYFPPLDRHVNYDIKKHPEKWESFKKFTYNQIEELMSDYGKIDILWLDGGWVNPKEKGQDIDMPKIASMARSHQPGLIVVDRAVPGRYENYRTPEQEIPDKPLGYVWETCMTMATSWSYVPNDTYKPTWKIIHMLVDIVAKGGNYLLNIGPSPEGEFSPDAYNRLKEIGIWMNVNNSVIYFTRPVAPYKENNICFTQKPDGSINAIYLAKENENQPPETISIASFIPKTGSTVTMLGISEPVKWEKSGTVFIIHVPESARNTPPCGYAWSFNFTKE
jgi:alpha-L-fucosidase